MKVGVVLTAAVALLGVMSAYVVLKPDTSEQDKIQSLQNDIKIYKDKKMPSDAIKKYQELLKNENFSNDYDEWKEYQEYCFDNGFGDEFISASKKMLSLNQNNTEPAKMVLNWYKENDPDEVYSWIGLLRQNLSEENYKEFGEYYDTIKGEYSIEKTGYKELGDWSLASFDDNSAGAYLIGKDSNDNTCIIGANANVLLKDYPDTICSFSYTDDLIAVKNDDQLVYTNFRDKRKRVPYDYDNSELLQYSYLGPYHNGIANYRDNDGKWGYLNSNADVIYNGFDYASAGSDGIFAIKNTDGRWSILHQISSSKLGKIQDTDYDDIKLDDYGYMEKNGIFFGSKDGLWYMNKINIDKKGNYSIETFDTAYEDAKVFGEYGAVKLDGKWGFVDRSGQMVIEPQFEDAKSFLCGFAAVKENDKWGYIDKTGKIIINCTFEDANSFSKYGVASVKHNDEWNLIQLNEYKISGGTY